MTGQFVCDTCGDEATCCARDVQEITCEEYGCPGCEWSHWKPISAWQLGCDKHKVKHGAIIRLKDLAS